VLEAVVIAGANGAGKTTFARQLLPVLYPDVVFLNVDEVQREDPAFAHPVAAGREILRRLQETERSRASFALETTLSSPMYARRILVWRNLGYRVSLHFIEVPSADFAVRRVVSRVAAGGHGVPEADVRRRFFRGLDLFSRIYKPIVDEWYHWISDDGGLRLGEHWES
jgi:predicted ABC-type ATPase